MKHSIKPITLSLRSFLKMTMIGCILLAQFQQAYAANLCGDVIATLDAQTIDQKIQSLAELKLSLDLAKVNGTSDIDITAMKANYAIKEKELVTYLAKNEIMTRNQLIEKIKQQISVLQKQNNIDQETDNKAKEESAKRREEQAREIKENVVDGTSAIFHKVTPSRFMMGEGEGQKAVTLTTIPEIMASKTTQIIYKTVAELANKRWPTKYQIEADPSGSSHKGDRRPVGNVSYEDAQKWSEALNDLSGAGEKALYDLIPSHKKGMKYGAFMTEAQREYLMKMAKTEDGESIDEIIKRGDTVKLHEYAVFKSNQSADVDSKKPLFIDGKPFYDLVGNAWEWVADSWDRKAALIGGKDPISKIGEFRVLRGGSWYLDAQYLRSASRKGVSPGVRYASVGFRLVRIVE